MMVREVQTFFFFSDGSGLAATLGLGDSQLFFFPEEYHSRVLDDLELATYDVKIFTTPHPRIFGLAGFLQTHDLHIWSGKSLSMLSIGCGRSVVARKGGYPCLIQLRVHRQS